MLEQESIIKQAVSKSDANPDSALLVEALLEREKQKAKNSALPSLNSMLGTWNLRFITGTKKTRKKAGVILGAGRYIPRLIKIQLEYHSDNPDSNLGKVINSVDLLPIGLSLSGPIEFFPRSRILAFDFTYLKLTIGSRCIYQGYIQNGLQRETEFSRTKLKNRAFFKYFAIETNAIAARGKGGGLALWSRART